MRRLLVLLVVCALLAKPATAQGVEERDQALAAALGHLVAQDPPASPALVEALAAAGNDTRAWPRHPDGPLDRLEVAEGTESVRAVHAVAVSGYDPRAFAGRDLVAQLRQVMEAIGDSDGIGDDAFALLALLHAGVPGDDPEVQVLTHALQERQQEDGGWSCYGPSSVDCTGYAVLALYRAGAPVDPTPVLAFLEDHHQDGGYRSDSTYVPEPNTHSTAWAIHALAALDQEVPEGTWSWLLARQTPSGGFAWKDAEDGPDLAATLEAVHALAGPLPWRTFDPYGSWQVRVPPEDGGGRAIVDVLGDFHRVEWTNEAGAVSIGDTAVVPLDPGERRVLHLHAMGNGTHVRDVVVLEGPVEGEGEASPWPAAAILAVLIVLAVARRPRRWR